VSGDYVSRDYLLGEYDRQHQGPPGGARKIIAEAPAADVVEVRHGRWEQVEILHVEDLKEEDKDCISIASMFCPKCKRYHSEVYRYGSPTESVRYCPNCGAVMDGGQDETPTGPYDLLYEEGGANTT